MYNIVTRDEESARNEIRFLTRNQSGRATFLPLTVCQPHYISKEAEVICNNTEGFLGFASDFVKLNELTQEKIKVEDELEHKMERWEYLEELNARIKALDR